MLNTDDQKELLNKDTPELADSPEKPHNGYQSRVRSKIAEWCRILLTAGVLTLLLTTYVVHAYRVDGRSMEPTFHSDDLLLVNKFIYRFTEIKRGDVVVLWYPDDPDKTFLKRVIALPGDTVEIRRGTVFINGVRQEEQYLVDEFIGFSDHYDQQKVKQAHYFVMGDHRKSSFDSRKFGFVPEKYIIGKVFLRYWPFNSVDLF